MERINKNASEGRYQAVRTHEQVFRAILGDLKGRLPGVIPPALDPKGNLDDIIHKYCKRSLGSMGFGIGEFEVGPYDPSQQRSSLDQFYAEQRNLKENEAVIEVHNIGMLSGGNYIYKYEFKPEDRDKVEFKGDAPGMKMMS